MAFYRDPLISSHHFGGFSKNGYFDVSPITRIYFYTNFIRRVFSCFFVVSVVQLLARIVTNHQIVSFVIHQRKHEIKKWKNIKSHPGFHNPDREIYFGGPRNPSVVLRFCDFAKIRRPTTSDEYFFQFFATSVSTCFYFYHRFKRSIASYEIIRNARRDISLFFDDPIDRWNEGPSESRR